MAAQLKVHNLSIVTRALQHVEPEISRSMTVELHSIGALVARDAQGLALSRIPHMTIPWSQMRVSQTPHSIYVVPRKKGVRGRGPKARPNFSPLMLRRSMRPALNRNQAETNRRFEKVVSVVCGKFSAGG